MSMISYDPRTIGLVSELIHPPMQVDGVKAQALHNALYHDAELRYANFQLGPQGVTMTNPVERPGQSSSLELLTDRIRIVEEHGPALVEDFGRKVVKLAGLFMDAMGVPVFMAQQHTLRMLVNPRSRTDSRDFLAGRVCRIEAGDFEGFGRPISLIGLKLVFPAQDAKQAIHALRIESWASDPRSVFLEDVATWPQPLQRTELERLGESVRLTREFLVERALGFLAAHEHGEG